MTEQFRTEDGQINLEVQLEEDTVWMTDSDLWPKKRDFKTFMEWVPVMPSDAVFEMGKGPIRVDDF